VETDRGILLTPYDPDAYAFGLVKNHPYLDGNKRIGFLAMLTFDLPLVEALRAQKSQPSVTLEHGRFSLPCIPASVRSPLPCS